MSKMIKLAMEGISGIPYRDPENVANTETRRMELMRSFFPDKTEITPESDNVYRINTTLDNGDFCEGGQKMEVVFKVEEELFEPKKVSIGFVYPEYGLSSIRLKPIERFRTVEPYLAGTVSSLKLNGQEIIDPSIEVLLVGRKMEDRGLHFSNGKDKIGNKQFKNGDDIAAYFHELGHLNHDKNDLNTKQLEKNDRHIHWLENDVGFGYKTTLSDFLVYKKRIYEERRASIKAMKMMSGKNLFPNDSDLLGPKSLFAENLTTYFYFYKNRFNELSKKLKKDIPRILDLDQDWHY